MTYRDRTDRTVHAKTRFGEEIVRYDGPGKWYAERPSYRRPLTLDEAVELVTWGDKIYWGRPGGRMFDARVKAYFFALYGEVPK